MSRFVVASATDKGHIRSINQDRSLATDYLVAVADGMGGHAGGEVAAKIAVDILYQGFQENNSTNGLLSAIKGANRSIIDRSFRQADLKGMGTTLVAAALVVDEDVISHIVIVNVGDSRAYLLSANGDLSRLTEDHSLVEELVSRGEITEAQALVHPHRHILTRALGIDDNVEIDAWELELDGSARILLCSDGLTNECSETEIKDLLTQYKDPKQAADQLVATALAHGGSDNVTVVIADVGEAGGTGNRGELLVSADKNAADNAEPEQNELGVAHQDLIDSDDSDYHMGEEGLTTAVPKLSAGGTEILAGSLIGTVAGLPEGAPSADKNQDKTQAGLSAALDDEANHAAANKSQANDLSAKQRQEPLSIQASSARNRQLVRHVISADRANSIKAKGTRHGTGLVNSNNRFSAPGKRVVKADQKVKEAVTDLPSPPLTFRIVVFVILFIAVFAGAGATVYWYLHSSYYVGIDNGYVAIFQGRPGGFLSIKPTLYKKTDLPVGKVFSPELPALKSGMLESSLAKAEKIVHNLDNAGSYLQLPAGNSAPAAESFSVPVGATPIFIKPGIAPTTTTFIQAPTTTTFMQAPTTTTSVVTTTLASVPTSSAGPKGHLRLSSGKSSAFSSPGKITAGGRS